MDPITPLDKNSRCTSGFCRSADDKCGCDDADHCLSSSEVCHSDNKCYSSELAYEDDCSADNGSAVDARCASGKCRSADDNTCGCTSNDHCPSDQVCYSGVNGDNKCHSRPSIVSTSTSCNAISGVESDGSAGDLIVDNNGNLIIIDFNGIITDVSSQFAPDAITTLENINNFIIAASQTVYVVGTLIVHGKRTQIDGELNGTGGGYAGAVGHATASEERALPGESPPGTNGHGRGGKSASGNQFGGGGGSHGKLLF